MSFWQKMLDKLSPSVVRSPLDDSETFLIYVLIPGAVEPVDRGAQYEDALEAELQLAGLGFVSGGGSLLGDEGPDGTRDIIHCGIDIEAVDVGKVCELLRLHLPELGCPAGTRIHYESIGGAPSFDTFDGVAWTLGEVWAGDDPRFG